MNSANFKPKQVVTPREARESASLAAAEVLLDHVSFLYVKHRAIERFELDKMAVAKQWCSYIQES